MKRTRTRIDPKAAANVTRWRLSRLGGVCVLALLVGAQERCSSSTAPASSSWVIDAFPYPSYMLVGDQAMLQVVAIDSLGNQHPGVPGATLNVSDARILQLHGDTLRAISVGRAELIIAGNWQGQALSTQRPIVVAPRPARNLRSE